MAPPRAARSASRRNTPLSPPKSSAPAASSRQQAGGRSTRSQSRDIASRESSVDSETQARENTQRLWNLRNDAAPESRKCKCLIGPGLKGARVEHRQAFYNKLELTRAFKDLVQYQKGPRSPILRSIQTTLGLVNLQKTMTTVTLRRPTAGSLPTHNRNCRSSTVTPWLMHSHYYTSTRSP